MLTRRVGAVLFMTLGLLTLGGVNAYASTCSVDAQGNTTCQADVTTPGQPPGAPVVPVINPGIGTGTGTGTGGGTGGTGPGVGAGNGNPAVPPTVFFPGNGTPGWGGLTAPCPAAGLAVCSAPQAPAAPAAPAAPGAPAAPAAPPPPSPGQLAQQAYSQIRLAKPTIGTAPCRDAGCMGAVGVPVWLWTQPWTPQTATAAAGGISVTVTASISNMVWNMGDGTTITCTSPGTAFNESMGFRDSPDCGYRYQHTSRAEPGGKYPISATANWDVRWTGAFTAATTVAAASTVQVVIGEYQALVQ